MDIPQTRVAPCDREPIHIPGSIQPHGLMLVADPKNLRIMHAADHLAAGPSRADWLGVCILSALGADAAAKAARVVETGRPSAFLLSDPPSKLGTFDVRMHLSGGWLIAELEPRVEDASSSGLLPEIEAAAAEFERAPNLQQVFNTAAVTFRRLTGYDRVMIYRFLEEDAGVVVAEDAAEGQKTFLNHHFPASDIPKQARALYVRNLVRVIPDVDYTPAPLMPPFPHDAPLDMSDAVLRSVSTIHVQYLKNMGVAASASFSIVKDGVLWGLIACHHDVPRLIPADLRAACRALAGGLARQIKAREETDAYRERVRLRSFEDDIVALLLRSGSLDDAISKHLNEIMRMLDGDGVAVLRGGDLVLGGHCPARDEAMKLAMWSVGKGRDGLLATDRLVDLYRLPEGQRALAAGVLALTISPTDPWVVLWFRAEQAQVVNWAGNPHKSVNVSIGEVLTPRTSFEVWTETVRDRSRCWTIPELEAAVHLRAAVTNAWQTRRIRDLNRELLKTLDEKDLLIRQKEFLVGEVNHRVQNSLQLVSSFLALQARSSDDPKLQGMIEEARRRIAAVSLVHRRLYRADQLESVDAARYIDELLTDLTDSLGPDWASHISSDLQPVMVPADRAVTLGLVLTEVVINANKYAYSGNPGPLHITLSERAGRFILIVADSGVGRRSTRKGFGSRMMEALVAQLAGDLKFDDNGPGTRVTVSAPIGKVPGISGRDRQSSE